ncbi:ADOP family duplicated permease [Silvibacterium acidisoli]|uniref:ADOP family duplicated permease n=1 Tax=Acidobacteriaceae bacterium ZG23-2 TaxID=2883246 RepID=UPI00406CCFD7
MRAINRLFTRVLNFVSNRRIDRRLQEEVAAHLDMQMEENVRTGMSTEEARRQAVLKFGSVQAVREECHREEGLPWMESLLQDLRFALRTLRRSPAFALVAITTLALGIGANTTVFSVVDAVLLRPLPYLHPERLVQAGSISDRGVSTSNLSYPDFFDWRSRNHSFSNLVSYHDASYTLTGVRRAIRVDAEVTSWDLLPALGVQPVLGRGFTHEEEKRGTRVVLLSNGLWKSLFASDKTVLGRTVQLSGDTFTVIGVMPANFRFPVTAPKTDVWTTLAVDDTPGGDGVSNRGMHWLNAIGRLAPGVTLAQADQEMKALAAQLAKQYPGTNTKHNSARVELELDAVLGDTKTMIVVILGAVSLVLLVACGNIANLLLARVSDRRREIAMRAALGAGRARILQQLLMESLVLSTAGGIAGCILAFLCTPVVLRLIGDSVPRAMDAGVNLQVLAFALLLTVVSGLFFGTVPAWKASNPDLVPALKTGGVSNVSGRDRLRSAVIVGQVALGIVLSAGAGLLIASFVKLMHQDIGFQPDHLLTFRFETPDSRYSKNREQFYAEYFQRLRALPGVYSAGGAIMLPMTNDEADVTFENPEQPTQPGERPTAEISIVSDDYFRTMQVPILKGREFEKADTLTATPVMLINQAFAEKYFPGEDPIGWKLKPGAGEDRTGGPAMREIVGVVGNVRRSMTQLEANPAYYLPAAQFPSWCCLATVVRTKVSPLSLEPSMRGLVTAMDQDIPITDVRTMPELMSLQLSQPRFAMVLLGAFAALALMLTAVGLYGVMMYSVSRRTREIGVRLALGAQRASVLRMVLRDASLLLAAGIAIGLVASLAFASMLRTMLYGTASRNPLVLAGVCAVVACMGMFAAWLPAQRAAKIEPVQALRID